MRRRAVQVAMRGDCHILVGVSCVTVNKW